MENSQVKSVGAEISKKSRPSDLKSLYKSGAAKQGQRNGNVDVRNEDDDEVRKKKRKSRKKVALSSFEPVGKKSRTSINEVDVDRLSLGSGGSDDSDRLLPVFTHKLNSGGALDGIPLNLDDEGNIISIPKKPRGHVRRKRFEFDSNLVLNQSVSSSSVNQIAKLNGRNGSRPTLEVELKFDSACQIEIPYVGSSSSSVQVAKFDVEPKGKAKCSQIVESKNDSKVIKASIPKVGSSNSVDENSSKLNGELKSKFCKRKKNSISKIGLSSAVDQIEKSKSESESKSSQQNRIVELKSSSAGKVLNAKVAVSSSSVDQVAKSYGESKRKKSKPKQQLIQADRNPESKVANTNTSKKRKNGFDETDENRGKERSGREVKKENGDVAVVDNGDASSGKIQSSSRKRKNLASDGETAVKKTEPLVDTLTGVPNVFQEDDEENLEENAARMLSSRFDPSCTGFSSKSRDSESLSSNGLTIGGQDFDFSGDPANRVLRPRKKYREKGLSRKRRHFYEIRSCDLDPLWFLNHRIKCFWPLDESWYYGLVNNYNPETKLHHVKYDDREEEWINLQIERFKLLLLPGEVPDCSGPSRSNQDDADESEPIISWLASSRRLKSSSFAQKKQKLSHLPSNGTSPNRIVDLLERESKSCSGSFFEINTSSRESKFPIVYARRRRKNVEGVGQVVNAVNERTKPSLTTQFIFQLHALFGYIFGAHFYSLFRTETLVRCGGLVTIWPKVRLEVLCVDNAAGLRYFVFEGCLKTAVAFVFSVLSVFNEPIKHRKCIDLQMPVTSITFKLSSVRDLKKHQVFEYYRFAKVRKNKWLYLDRKLQPNCLTTKQLPLTQCTYDNIKTLEHVNKRLAMSSIEVSENHFVHGTGPKETSLARWNARIKRRIPPPFALSFTAAPGLFRSLHLELFLEHSRASMSLNDRDSVYSLPDTEYSSDNARENIQETATSNGRLVDPLIKNPRFQKLELDQLASGESISSPTLKKVTSFDGISIELPLNKDEEASDMPWNTDISPTPTASRSLCYRNKSTSVSSPVYIPNGFGNGPKKPRTQVRYTSPPGFDFGSKHRNPNQNGYPYKRIRRSNDKRSPSDGSRRNLELQACDANVLITEVDRGRRESEARIVLELADHNEWKIAVKISGATKFSYKVRKPLTSSTNRFTHAMMWKGGNDWTLEFPDRGQWVLFKEMHGECYNRNIRAVCVKNIPIPGVRLIDESGDSKMGVLFTRNYPKYFRQVEDDVEMAMDPERVLYDMDSDDERWVLKNRKYFEDVSDECFERIMDMFEKVAYAKQKDHFTTDEMEELVHGVESIEVIKVVYNHWEQKRQIKGMPLIRHLQPPSWGRYQQQLKEWEKKHGISATATTAPSSESQENPAIEKPAMFAFCLKPRGLEVTNIRGTKHRSLRRFSTHSVPPDHDPLHSFGRRLNGNAYGDNGHDSSDASPLLQPASRGFSPRDAGPGYFSLSGGGTTEWNHHPYPHPHPHPKLHRNKSKKIATFLSQTPQKALQSRTVIGGKRNGSHRTWNRHHHHDRQQPPERGGPHRRMNEGADMDEFRLRDASGAAQHALNMAKLKREKAQRLLYRADLAIHKAVNALMAADAIKASCEESSSSADSG
jgi:hypothetical protein